MRPQLERELDWPFSILGGGPRRRPPGAAVGRRCRSTACLTDDFSLADADGTYSLVTGTWTIEVGVGDDKRVREIVIE